MLQLRSAIYIFAAAIAVLLTGCTNKTYKEYTGPANEIVLSSTDIFSPLEIKHAVGCIYYDNERIAEKNHDAADLQKDMQCINDYINTIFDSNISLIITDINYDIDSTFYNAYFLFNDNIIIDQPRISFELKHNTVVLCDYDPENINSDCTALENMEFYDAEQARIHAAMIAIEHRDEILGRSDQKSSLQGTYCMIYHENNNSAVYHFTLNNGSYIEINASSGEIEDTYFFNGIYY